MKGCRPLTDVEIDRVLANVPTWRERALLMVCLYLGARLSEALALDLSDVVIGDGGSVDAPALREHVTFRKVTTKGKAQSRAVKAAPSLRAVLSRYIERQRGLEPGPLFRAGASGPGKEAGTTGRLSRTQGWRLIRAALDAAGVVERTGTHSFRKTFAQRLHDGGVEIAVISELLGHVDVRDTMRYFGVTDEQADRAVSLLPSSALPSVSPSCETTVPRTSSLPSV